MTQLMWWRRAWTIVPGITMNVITTSDVPSVRFNGIPRIPAMTGTRITPPPIPRSPEANPATSPVTAKASPDGWAPCSDPSGTLRPVPTR